VKEVHLIVPGKAVPLSRAGHGQFGGKFLTAPTSKQIGLVVDAWQRAGEPRFDDDTPLHLVVTFGFERPSSHFGTGRNAGKLKPSARPFPTGRPDLSNLVKLVEDALNENAFKDDSRIVATFAAKKYAERSRTEIVLREAA
jgi:Holliday junction resolvase RusA-like endonuclease